MRGYCCHKVMDRNVRKRGVQWDDPSGRMAITWFEIFEL